MRCLQPQEECWGATTPTHGNSRFNRYVNCGVGQVEAFALATSPLASALFDRVIAAGLEPGVTVELAADLLVKEIWYTVRAAPACRPGQ